MQREYMIFSLRILLGAIFLVSGISKVIAFKAFEQDILSFHIIPPFAIYPVVLLICAIEVISAILLIVGSWVKVASSAIAFLLLTFIAAMVPILLDPNVDQLNCGCFGSLIDEHVDFTIVIRDILLTSVCLLIFLYGSTRFSLENLIRESSRSDTSGS